MNNDLANVFKHHIRKSDTPRPFGSDGRIRVNYFLDLMTAVHDQKQLDIVANYFALWIQDICDQNSFSGIATPKRGNVLLTHAVSKFLRKNSCFVKHDILFGSWIEGTVTSGDDVIVIDDIASDGELLIDAIDSLKQEGVYTTQVLVLVERSEGDAQLMLDQRNIDYRSCFQFSDQDLVRLSNQIFPNIEGSYTVLFTGSKKYPNILIVLKIILRYYSGMTKTLTKSYTLTPQLNQYVSSEVESGEFTNDSEVVRAALRFMKEHRTKLKHIEAIRSRVKAAEQSYANGDYDVIETQDDFEKAIISDG